MNLSHTFAVPPIPVRWFRLAVLAVAAAVLAPAWAQNAAPRPAAATTPITSSAPGTTVAIPWQSDRARVAAVAAAYGVAPAALPAFLERQDASLAALVARTGYAFTGFAAPQGREVLAALLEITAQLPPCFACVPGLYRVSYEEPNRILGTRERLRGRFSAPAGTVRLYRIPLHVQGFPGMAKVTYVHELAHALDRHQRYSEDPRFLAMHGWYRAWFGLGAWHTRNQLFAEQGRWQRAGAGDAAFSPREAFAFAAADFYTDPWQAFDDPLYHAWIQDVLNQGRAARVPDLAAAGPPPEPLQLRWEDSFGLVQTLPIGSTPATGGSTRDFAWLASRFADVCIGYADAGDRFESHWGHALLLLEVKADAAAPMVLPDLAVTPLARVVGPLSRWHGLVGGYPSYYAGKLTRDSLREYQFDERPVSVYRLSDRVTPEQRQRLILATLYYLHHYRGNYRFLDENCAVLLRDLLCTALPAPDAAALRAAWFSGRFPGGVMDLLRERGLLDAQPVHVWPGRTDVLRADLARSGLPPASVTALEAYLKRRAGAARLYARAGLDSFPALCELRFARADALHAPSAGGTTVPPLFRLELINDVESVYKRFLDETFYNWLGEVSLREFEGGMRAGGPTATRSAPAARDEYWFISDAERYYCQRASEFHRFVAAGLPPAEPAPDAAPAAWTDAADRLRTLSRAFRDQRLDLAERFFRQPFPAAARHRLILDNLQALAAARTATGANPASR